MKPHRNLPSPSPSAITLRAEQLARQRELLETLRSTYLEGTRAGAARPLVLDGQDMELLSVSIDGEAVSTDCSNCHQVLVMDRPAAQVRLTAEATD